MQGHYCRETCFEAKVDDQNMSFQFLALSKLVSAFKREEFLINELGNNGSIVTKHATPVCRYKNNSPPADILWCPFWRTTTKVGLLKRLLVVAAADKLDS